MITQKLGYKTQTLGEMTGPGGTGF